MESPSKVGSQCASSAKKSRLRKKTNKDSARTLDGIRENMYEPPKKRRKEAVNEGTQKCSQQAYYRLIERLTPNQRSFIIAADLGHLLQIKPMNIRRQMCRWLANTYDVKSKTFILKGDQRVSITLKDVENIMGLPSNGRDFHPIGGERTSKLFAELKDKSKSGITLTSLLQRMNNKDLPLEDFLQCFVLYTIGIILCPTTATTVNAKYLTLVDTVQKIKSINWAKLTLDHLLQSIASYRLGKANLEGNLSLLQVWYWEKLRLNNLDATIDYSERDIPLMQYWTEEKARKADKIDDLFQFGAGTLVQDYMKPAPPLNKSSKPAGVQHQNMPPQFLEHLQDISTSIMHNRGLSKIEYDHLVREHTETRKEVRRVDLNVRSIMLHLGIQDTGVDKETNVDKFGDDISMNLDQIIHKLFTVYIY